MLATVLIAAGLAVAPAEGLKFNFKKRYGGDDYKRPANNGIYHHRHVRKSTARCTAVAVSKNFSIAKDAHVHAVRAAWKHACSSEIKGDKWWQEIYKSIKTVQVKKGHAFAFAKAITAAYSACDTHGNAYGCSAAYAYTKAWASAVATAHAAAWASAVQECECNGEKSVTATESDAYAHDVYWLEAKVHSSSESYACGHHGIDDKDYSAQTCVEGIYVTVLAKAVAHAAIDGHCVNKSYYGVDKTYSEYVSKAYTEATAKIVADHVYGCVGYIDGYNPYH